MGRLPDPLIHEPAIGFTEEDPGDGVPSSVNGGGGFHTWTKLPIGVIDLHFGEEDGSIIDRGGLGFDARDGAAIGGESGGWGLQFGMSADVNPR